ncbi:hypothetical protein IKF73_03255 [Candidatus Saccharibacteria bacterium]|nr:hypothetical protein [Candidatus Saccharibacteria bacterium]
MDSYSDTSQEEPDAAEDIPHQAPSDGPKQKPRLWESPLFYIVLSLMFSAISILIGILLFSMSAEEKISLLQSPSSMECHGDEGNCFIGSISWFLGMVLSFIVALFIISAPFIPATISIIRSKKSGLSLVAPIVFCFIIGLISAFIFMMSFYKDGGF